MLTAFTACQKDEMSAPDAGATSSFTVSIPQSGVQSRAVTDDFGKGTSVNRCILEIYHGDQLYNRIVKPVSNKWKSHATLTLLATQDLPTFGYNMIDPLKSWCWGSILFYPFKISRFS